MNLSPGSVVGGYSLVGLRGEGGMGLVWEADQVSLSRRVALKVVRGDLASDLEFRLRFQDEARAAAAVNHPNVVTVYDSGEVDGCLYISMALVEGPNLRELLIRKGPLAAGRAVGILSGVAAGLDAAHAAGIVHRDVKPANILFEAGSDTPLITDFGIAKAMDSAAVTSTGAVVGTLRYMSPEQIQGMQADRRSDIYCLGLVFHEMLTGESAFARETPSATMWAQVHEGPAPVADRLGLSLELDRVLAAALAKNPDHRYATATDFAAAAAAALGSPGPTAHPTMVYGFDQSELSSEPGASATIHDSVPTIRVPQSEMATAAGSPQGPETVFDPPSDWKAPVYGTEPQQFSSAGPASNGNRGKLIAIAGGVLSFAVLAGVAVALSLSGSDKSAPKTPSSVNASTIVKTETTIQTETTTQSQPTTESTTKAAASSSAADTQVTQPVSGYGFSATVPEGWRHDIGEQSDESAVDSWVNPDDHQVRVLIQSTRSNGKSAADWVNTEILPAHKTENPRVETANLSADYDARRLTFTRDGTLNHDYFIATCGRDIAVWGSAPERQFDQWSQIFRDVADSVICDS